MVNAANSANAGRSSGTVHPADNVTQGDALARVRSTIQGGYRLDEFLDQRRWIEDFG
jgi:hypothetical protein